MTLLRQGFRRRQAYGGQDGGQGRRCTRPLGDAAPSPRSGIVRGGGAAAPSRSRNAFTLLEVLVALAVFALGAIVLGAAYVNVLNAYELVQRGNQADEDLRFARGQLLAEPDRAKAEQGGDFASEDGRAVKWHATIETTATADLFRVTFACELADSAGGARQTVTENFTVLRPTWADPVENGKLRQDAFDRIQKLQGKKPQ